MDFVHEPLNDLDDRKEFSVEQNLWSLIRLMFLTFYRSLALGRTETKEMMVNFRSQMIVYLCNWNLSKNSKTKPAVMTLPTLTTTLQRARTRSF